MLMTVDELKEIIETDEKDAVLAMRLNAIEQSIRSYTNNSFINRGTLQEATVLNGALLTECDDFKKGNTVELFYTRASNGLYVISEVVAPCSYTLDSDCPDCEGKVALVSYPADVLFGAAMMIQYDIDNAGREGVASETISRHSVSYVALGDSNSLMGYPTKLTSFLRPYRRVKR